MLVNRNNFKDAFRDAISYEFLTIPKNEEEISYTFSPKFEKKMEKLIKAQQNSYWMLVNTATKRMVVACIVLIFLITTACSVKSIREPIVQMFTDVYEQFIHFILSGDVSDTIVKEYQVTFLPVGFEQTEKFTSETTITTVYENADGRIIEFTQTISDGIDLYLDSENGENFDVTYSNLNVHIHTTEESYHAFWIQDTYILDVVCYGYYDMKEMEKLILGVKE